ncbi:hypothetical protein A9G43_04850 [Gilliamella sp. Occ3-1]|nr:hypothetical protein A9G43_04850 [Gilliamella apicola]
MKYKQLIFSTSKKSLTLDVGSELLSFYQLHEKLKGRFGWLLKYGLAITFFPLLGGGFGTIFRDILQWTMLMIRL